MQSRGLRNNNPGNIRKTSDPWQGLAAVQGDDAFFTFEAPKWGIRAMARILIHYQDKSGCTMIRHFISKWAPSSENNTEAYVRSVADQTGIAATAIINVHDYDVMRPLVAAIINHENGQQPYTDAEIDAGLALAGVVPPARPLIQTRTIKGAAVVAVGTVASYVPTVIEAFGGQAGTLRSLAQYWPYAGSLATVAVMCGVIAIVWARIDDRRKLQR